jgi:thiol-disulfide isomerase/thioredoxin
MHMPKFLLIPALALMLCFPVVNQSYSAESKYYALTPQEIIDYAKQVEGRKAIFIYASWCPHCRRALPKIVEIQREYPGSIMPISVDRKPKKLAAYLSEYRDLPFYPVLLKSPDPYGLEKALRVPYRTGVPHYILLDEKNRVVKSANLHTEEIARFIAGK